MYILDKIDAVLDVLYKQHIATLFRTRSCGAQFIVVSLQKGVFTNAIETPFSARDSATALSSSNEVDSAAILVCIITLMACGRTGRQMERQWLWVRLEGIARCCVVRAA